MLRCDHGATLLRGSQECSAGQRAGTPQKPARSLMDRQNRLLAQKLLGGSGQLEVVAEVAFMSSSWSASRSVRPMTREAKVELARFGGHV